MSPPIDRSAFRAYDVRGDAEHDLGDQLVRDLGSAIAKAIGDGRPIAVGRDCRLSSPRLRDALVAGLTAAGADVIDLGVVPSPVLYFACHHLDVAGGVEITGSHNPPGDNGFKIVDGTTSLTGPAIADLADRIAAGIDPAPSPGRVDHREIDGEYLEHARSTLALGEREIHLVVDGGNGTAGPIAAALYRSLGCEVDALYCEPDGRFPNRPSDPTVAANLAGLIDRVAATGAELGVALDGDGDRIVAVDERGRILGGDQLTLLLGLAILDEVPGATIIGEVKCSQVLFDGIEAAGGTAIMGEVGHSLIKARLAETGAALAGEMSGHLFFAHRYLGFDDGAYAGARLIELLSNAPATLADRLDALPAIVATPELRLPCPDPTAAVERALAALAGHPEVLELVCVDGVRARFAGGWGLIRASNTEPVLSLRFEADNAERLGEIRGIIQGIIGD